MANQATLTENALEQRISTFFSGEGTLDGNKFATCLANHASDPILLRDEQLTDTYHVTATPTVFINGVRKMGFGSFAEFDLVIRSALNSARQANELSKIGRGGK
jgi:protein-disulfide isomerase